MCDFYDGFEIYNFNDRFNPNKPINEDETKSTTPQQLLSISNHYAPDFFNTMKLQKMDYLREQGKDLGTLHCATGETLATMAKTRKDTFLLHGERNG
eukprot:2901021-Amphidinium_carterae.1